MRRIASLAIAIGLAGCSTSPTYSTDPGNAAPAANPAPAMTSISIESKPTGATISVDGVQVGTAPTSVLLELDPTGRFLAAVDISGDFSVNNPIRGVAHVVTANFRRGDSAPRQLVIARPVDGGIQRSGSFAPGR